MTLPDDRVRHLSLPDLIEAKLGVRTEARLNRETGSVGVSRIVVLRNDSKRIAALLVNLSANIIYVAADTLVSTTRSIRLAPNGGSLKLVWYDDFDIVGWEWWAIASAAASDLFTYEVTTR